MTGTFCCNECLMAFTPNGKCVRCRGVGLESFLVTGAHAGGHVYVKIRVGQEGQRALAGSFNLRKDEWERLRDVLAAAGATTEDV